MSTKEDQKYGWFTSFGLSEGREIIRSVGKQKQGIEAASHLFLYFNP
jgi:hypothetical protein